MLLSPLSMVPPQVSPPAQAPQRPVAPQQRAGYVFELQGKTLTKLEGNTLAGKVDALTKGVAKALDNGFRDLVGSHTNGEQSHVIIHSNGADVYKKLVDVNTPESAINAVTGGKASRRFHISGGKVTEAVSTVRKK